MVKSQTFIIGRLAIDSTAIGIQPLQVDLPRLVDTRMLIQANSGGGKSWLLRLMAERVADKIQIIFLDPEGEFATLREKIDIALVGEGGEIAADVRSAALLARKLTETRISAIVDLYSLKLAKRREFVRRFLDELMDLPRALWHPMLVILDEAQLFAPEKSAGEAESTGSVIALASQGRKRGIAGIIATQRLSKLHKDVAAETNNVVIGRTWLDVDQQRAGDMLGMNKQTRIALRDLAQGEFYMFGPAINRNGVVRFRSDRVETTHPKAGERHLLEVPKASEAIREIVAQLGDLPKQAEEQARTLAEAQRKIAELERQLRGRPVQVEQRVETRVERIEVPVLRNDEAGKLMSTARGLSELGAQLASLSSEIRKAVDDAARMKTMPVRAIATVVPPRAAGRVVREGSRATARVAPTGEITDIILRSGERKMLQVMAARYPAKYTRSQLGTLAGFTPSGGTFGNYFGTLKRVGFLVEAGRDVEITQAGLDFLGADVPPTPETTGELLAMWKGALREGERKMLDQLMEVYPDGLSFEELGERTGFTATGGTFGNYLGTLRRNGLAETSGKQAKASSTLFVG